ncbi:MAG: LacI family DNA-binding transcriptional regulator [Aristaeellaceae bacterium]
MRKVTIKDVAREAGVSIATVSNALNNVDVVQEKTRNHILEVAQRLHYVPNMNGKRLRASDSRVIGMFVTTLESNYMGNLADSIEQGCLKQGYDLQVFFAHGVDDLLEKLQSGNIDGAILHCGMMTDDDKRRVSATGMPVVFLDNEWVGPTVSSVTFQSYEHGRMAAEYLYGLGHRQLMYVKGAVTSFHSQQRQAGFLDAAASLGLTIPEEQILMGDYRRRTAYRALRQYLQSGQALPHAIFAANDHSAIGCMEALKECSVRIPEDVSIIGYDDNEMCSMVHPALTTIRTDLPQLGVLAASEILRLMNHASGQQVTIPGELIVRQSCKLRWAAAQTCAGVSPLHPTRGIAP